MANELKPYVERVNYNETFAGQVEEAVRRSLSESGSTLLDGESNANIADFARLVIGMMTEAATKASKLAPIAEKTFTLTSNGISFSIDLTTNEIASHENIDDVADGIVAALGAVGVAVLVGTFGTGIAVGVGLAAVGFFAGNYVGSWIPDIADKYLGSNVFFTYDKNSEMTAMTTNSLFEYAIRDYWDYHNAGMAYYFNNNMPFKFTTNHSIHPFSFTFKEKTFTFEKSSNELLVKNGEFEELLKYLPVHPNDLKIKFSDINTLTLQLNYLSKNTTQALIESEMKAGNKDAQFAVFELEPYVFKDDSRFENFQTKDLNTYSDNHIEDRIIMFYKVVNDENGGRYFFDQKTGIGIGQTNADSPGNYSRTVFVDTNYEYAPAYGKTYGQFTFYGNEKNNVITAKSRSGNYIEGGLGSDTITTGMGDDTIYTNANIDSQYDHETASTVNTVYAGDGEDKIYGSNGTDIIYADSDSSANPNEYDNKDLVEGRGGSDKIYGGDGRDTLYADSASSHADTSGDYIVGGLGADTIHGSDGNDTLYGDNETDDASWVFSDKDTIHGYGGSDTIYGGADDDTLIGGMEGGVDDGASDHLEGGKGKDTYLVNNGDTIMDSDGEGLVKFDNIDLTGKKYKNSKTDRYEDDDYIYDGNPDGKGPLTVTSLKDSSKSITIQAWENKALGIELLDNKDIEVSITPSASASEGDSGKRSLSFTVTLSRALEDGEVLDVSVSNTDEGSYIFKSGEQSKTFTYSWNGDRTVESNVTATLAPSASYAGPSDDVNVTIKNSGIATVYDDDEDKRHDPLALDTNKDGFISTSDLETSGTYFDITGDGLRERVGWIKSEDALVTYDKNDNGQIDGISEVFGNMNESGFEELKRLIDSNHDNIIDRKDELFNRLQVWNDFNQDAKVQEGELRSLKDAGVTSIDLNYVSTNIEINGNLLTEASKYTDAQGNKELAADIQLATDAKDTKLDLEDLPQDFTIDPATELLPQLKGTGLVYDSLITYNLDPEFKALAQEMSTNIPRVATEFSTFLEHFSGYTVYVNELREKYSIENFEMQEVDKQAWIVERFEATDKYTTTINNYYNSNLNKGRSPTTPITESDTVATKYQALTDTLQSTFTMQSVYQDVFSDTHYDLDTQSFIVDDKNAFETKLAEYFNSDTNTIDEKLYLAKVMHLQQGGLEFEIDTILKSINNDITKELARKDVALQKYTTIKINTNHRKTSPTCQEYFASIKKHFCTITCQDGLWHVAQNNTYRTFQNKAA